VCSLAFHVRHGLLGIQVHVSRRNDLKYGSVQRIVPYGCKQAED